MNPAQQKARLQELAAEARSVVDSKTIDMRTKKFRMSKIEGEFTSITDAMSLTSQANGLCGAGDSASFTLGLGTGTAGGAFYGTKSLHAAPSITPTQEQMRELHEAIVSRKSMQIEVKTATDVSGLLPPSVMPGIVERRHEPQRVLDFIPSAPVSSPSWEYFRHSATTGTMTTVAPGAAKPELSFTVDTVTGVVRKIAAHTAVEDETLQDFSGFASYVSSELTRIYIDAENAQILAGDGIGTNILGVLSQSGILTRDLATDFAADGTNTALDTLERAITDLRVGTAFAEADLVVLHPTTWSIIRRTKNSLGNYVLGDPSVSDARTLWGVPVITTTSIAAATGLVAQMSLAGEARIRQGVTIDTTPYNSDDWTHNLTRFRIEARVGLGVVRPAAICKVTTL
jgi:HK97 family phage major capsid protein